MNLGISFFSIYIYLFFFARRKRLMRKRAQFADVGAKLWFKAFINLLRFKIHFASKLAFKCNFGSKLVKVRKGTTALLAKPQFSLSYNLSLSWQALTF